MRAPATDSLSPAGPRDLRADLELCGAVREHDRAAFQELYRRHYDRTVRAATGLVGPTDAEDVAADTFEDLFSALWAGKGPESGFRGYLATALRHRAVRWLREAERQVPTDLAAAEAGAAPPVTSAVEPSPEDEALREFEDVVLRDAYRAVSPASRRVLWLVDVQGRSYAEAARELSVSLTTVTSTLRRARVELADAWLVQHLPAAADAVVHPSRTELVRLASGRAGLRRGGGLGRHVRDCLWCTAQVAEVRRMNRSVRRTSGIAPVPLLVVWAAWLRDHLGSALGWARAHRLLAALVVAGTLGVGMLLTTDAASSDEPPAGGPVATPSASPGPDDPGSRRASVRWLSTDPLRGAEPGDEVALDYQIVPGDLAGRSMTVTVTAAVGTELVAAGDGCTVATDQAVCRGLTVDAVRATIDGQVRVRVLADGPVGAPAIRLLIEPGEPEQG